MQLAAVWLAALEAHAQALCLLEAQLLSGGLPAAQQVSTNLRDGSVWWVCALACHQHRQGA